MSEGRWGQTAVVEGKQSRSLRFQQWQHETGCDLHSTLTKGSPQKLRVIVQPNAHESGRAHIAVLNPERLPVVGVDLSQVLRSGQLYRIVSVKDYYGAPLVVGTFDGQPVQVPMSPVAGAAPLGLASAKKLATEPAFAAFVVLPGK